MENPILKTNNLTKEYIMGDVKVVAINDVDLEIYPGELIVILGQSGSGKSTLMNILGGMDRATQGEVFYKERDIEKFKEGELTDYRKENVGFIFQFYNLIPTLTAIENVEIAGELVKEPLNSMEALEMVGLAERKDSFPSQLSGGEQQRVAIARAIIKNPELLFCDEPTGALDSKTGKMVLRVLQEINQKYKKTIVIITHNVQISEMATRVIKMADGKIVEDYKNESQLEVEKIEW